MNEDRHKKALTDLARGLTTTLSKSEWPWWLTRFQEFPPEDVQMAVDRILSDANRKPFFPSWPEFAKRLPNPPKVACESSVDLQRSIVWSTDGRWEGNMDAISMDKRRELAGYMVRVHPKGFTWAQKAFVDALLGIEQAGGQSPLAGLAAP